MSRLNAIFIGPSSGMQSDYNYNLLNNLQSHQSGEEDLLLFGFAFDDETKKTYRYKLSGSCIGETCQLTLEVSNDTDEGTYTSEFTLEAVFEHFSEILDTFPEQKDILSWVKAAFGVPAGHQEWKTVEEKGTLFHEIVGKYAVNGTVILPSLPPRKHPLIGNLEPGRASEVRLSILDDAIRKAMMPESKLAALEKQKREETPRKRSYSSPSQQMPESESGPSPVLASQQHQGSAPPPIPQIGGAKFMPKKKKKTGNPTALKRIV